MEPITPVYRDSLIGGKKISESHKKNRLVGEDHHILATERLDKWLAEDIRDRDEYTKTGKRKYFKDNQSDPDFGKRLDERVDETRADLQKRHKEQQEDRLKGGKYWPTVKAEDDDYLAELYEWRRKHGKKGKK